jgi:hypothetical protein
MHATFPSHLFLLDLLILIILVKRTNYKALLNAVFSISSLLGPNIYKTIIKHSQSVFCESLFLTFELYCFEIDFRNRTPLSEAYICLETVLCNHMRPDIHGLILCLISGSLFVAVTPSAQEWEMRTVRWYWNTNLV